MNHLTVFELYQQFAGRKAPRRHPRKIIYSGIGERDVYNPSCPFVVHDKTILAGRVEARDSESSEIMFFEERECIYHRVPGSPVYCLQDPFVSLIDGEIILGGVETFPHPDKPDALWWRTVFFRGRDISCLEQFATGPNGMKDIRLCATADGKISVFTRPRHAQGNVGGDGGRGMIGYTEINSLSELTPENIQAAVILDQLHPQDWLGANEVHDLGNGQLGVLCHVATYDYNNNRHYFAAAFNFDRHTRRSGALRIIAERADFLPGDYKRPDLHDVLFPSGLLRANGGAVLYCGVSDCETQAIEITDPFIF